MYFVWVAKQCLLHGTCFRLKTPNERFVVNTNPLSQLQPVYGLLDTLTWSVQTPLYKSNALRAENDFQDHTDWEHTYEHSHSDTQHTHTGCRGRADALVFLSSNLIQALTTPTLPLTLIAQVKCLFIIMSSATKHISRLSGWVYREHDTLHERLCASSVWFN